MMKLKKTLMRLLIVFSSFLLTSCMHEDADQCNWPQYRNDAGRTGYTPQQLSGNLGPRWIYHFGPVDKSWTGTHTRMTFDHAHQPVISGKMLYIGNSNDNKIYALNRKSGEIVWTYYTDGPVRFAPAIYEDRLYVVSDDGFIYCLSAKSGELIWRKYGAPEQDMVLGNERMISRWPIRGGLVIKNGVLYFGAGIWPSEKIFIYALDPDDGKVLWVNNSCGEIEMPQPHPTAVAESGLSAQGYLAIGSDKLFVPTGRAVPAALDLKSGKMDYFHLQRYRNIGGSAIMSTDSFLFVPNGNTRFLYETRGTKYAVFNNGDGSIIPGGLNAEAVAISPGFIYCINNETHQVEAYRRDSLLTIQETRDRKGGKEVLKNFNEPVWSANILEDYVKSLIVTGNRLIAGTVTGKILILDNKNGKLISSYKVNGIPLGLAVAHQSLFVSTDQGSLYCFDEHYNDSPNVFFNDFSNYNHISDEVYMNSAEEIISKSAVKNGYCLDLEGGDGSLACELARKTNLKIVVLENDKKNVVSARKKLSDAGLYGSRVVVFHGNINTVPLPDYFANLIVSQKSLEKAGSEIDSLNVKRCQKPEGGIVVTGKPGKMKLDVRGGLEGAGQWTHQYHDPANSTVSEDEIINGELEMLWFKDSEFDMPSRHGRGVGPLYKDGRLFVQGNDAIRAVDAYNGQLLWEYYMENLMAAYDQEHICGTAITHGNWCIEDDRLFVRRGLSMWNRSAKECDVLDTRTGSRIATYNAPEGYWGYIAVKNGILYGSVANVDHIVKWAYGESDMNNQFSESHSIFAIEVSTGELLWEFKAENSIRHNTIAIGNDKIFFIDRPVAEMDLISRRGVEKEHEPGVLIALDAETGENLFKKNDNIWGTLLILNEKYNKLIMSYSDTRFKLPSEKGGKIAVLDAINGHEIWEAATRKNLPENYFSSSKSRPVVNDSIIFVEPETFDLFTGAVIDNNFHRSYGCGIVSGSKNMLFFRSATAGYCWLDNMDAGIQNYGGIRPGCWINMIPAGGLVLMPDATARCDCSYLMKSWIALKPAENF
jgi:outer membrane protein assembly factor BamB